MSARKLNINADMGESFGAYVMGNDAALLDIVTSANVACGYHGGDPLVMQETVKLAHERGVSIGAHPSFPDRQGFGRRRMFLDAAEIEAMIIYQIGALAGFAQAQGMKVTHVKPHGALSNMAAEDMVMAKAIAKAVKAVDPALIFMALAGSCLAQAAADASLTVANEIFADRTYDENGNLTPRAEPHSMIHDPDQSAQQILSFLEAGGIVTPSGKVISADLHSICVHGDNPNAIALAGEVRNKLEDAGIAIRPLPECL